MISPLSKMAQLESNSGCKRFIYTDDDDTVTVIVFDDNGWTGQDTIDKVGARAFWDSLVTLGWKAAITSKLRPELVRQRRT